MTHKVGNAVIIEPEAAQKCARCKKTKECRDVLGDGTRICFSCATEREKRAYMDRLFGIQRN